MRLNHPFDPIFDKGSSILVLGTFPSVKSREQGFYYGHPQNRFWKIIASVTNAAYFPETISAKKQMLFSNKIALWDVVKSCEIRTSSDGSIKHPAPVDLSFVLSNSNVFRILINGGKAFKIFKRFFHDDLNKEVIKLPSTSSANAKYNFENLLSAWKSSFL
ncbi:MAG: DNA-deoxyinosine glycosylase [Holosporales bacterium]|nr:DNA-deoxyinosine glycosylase [Holosporales bacterium]